MEIKEYVDKIKEVRSKSFSYNSLFPIIKEFSDENDVRNFMEAFISIVKGDNKNFSANLVRELALENLIFLEELYYSGNNHQEPHESWHRIFYEIFNEDSSIPGRTLASEFAPFA